MENIHQKIKANAISAYFMLFISVLFLFNKTNPYLNNEFVKNHTKTAFFIHLIFLLIYIVFIHFWLFKTFIFFWYSFNNIIVSTLFILTFWLLIYWIYRANHEQTFKIWEIFKFVKSEKLIDVDNNQVLDEKDKLTVILGYIPFISYIIYPNFEENRSLRDTIKLNFFVSLLITIVYISWYTSLSTFFILLYIIFVVYASINVVLKSEVISFNLSFLPRIKDSEILLKTWVLYLKNYINWTFKPVQAIIEELRVKNLESRRIEEENIKNMQISKLTNKLIYIPILNLIYLFSLDTKYRNHIINWLSLTIITIILFLIYPFSNIFYLLLFPICFGLWYIKSDLTYKMPFIFHVFNSFILIKNKLSNLKSKATVIKNTVKEESFKVEEK